ncbi:2Fe-2S iron-sulfur cluster-binding protein [uncultured Enterovirga sp.]|uniref:2Fe-2S iron-sulfur cluster-binding protein n=1 Tax=uncultured Enterovirga sp. TaxID=2026352 RepID=UPI0035CA2D99
MSTTTIVVNGRGIRARTGQTILEAALAARIVIPHDCATGQCNTCRVRVYDGTVDDRGTQLGDSVLACRSTILGEAVIEYDEVPGEERRVGAVLSIEDLTADIVQVVMGLETRLLYLPGQYVKVEFRGFPARDYSPTLRLDGSADLTEIVLQIRREERGVVSTALGLGISAGHPVKVRGPFGSAYHRLGTKRLVLVSTGVGFAPIWAIARASRLREPGRALTVIAGARHAHNLYMRPALDWLSSQGATVMLTCSGADDTPGVLAGRPTLHLPRLTPTDTIVACGAPGMVASVELLAAAGGATCYSDPFLPARAPASLRDRLLGFFRR